VASVSKDDGRDSAIREALMAPKRRIKKLAALVDTTPETLAEVIGDVLRETVNELQTYEPRACGRIARDIRRHRKTNAGA
jgi:galactose-1-phosphate uridylyltransferase